MDKMGKGDKWQDALDGYLRAGEPGRAEKSAAWKTAIGLQAVDGLETSPYLLETARDHIEGRVDIAEALEESIRHLAGFVSGIWQIHPFREGNTRTTAMPPATVSPRMRPLPRTGRPQDDPGRMGGTAPRNLPGHPPAPLGPPFLGTTPRAQ